MSGPAAPLSPLAATHNLVVELTPAEDADWEDVDAALRRGLVSVAAHLAEAALDAEPDAVEELAEPGGSTANGKPRVGVILNLQTQGKFKDVFVYGRSLSGGLPTVISPGELDDGAVVSGQFGHPALKNPTFLHQNHPVVAALRARRTSSSWRRSCSAPSPSTRRTRSSSRRTPRGCAPRPASTRRSSPRRAAATPTPTWRSRWIASRRRGSPRSGSSPRWRGATGPGRRSSSRPTKATALVSTGNYDERMTLPAVERALGRERDRPARPGRHRRGRAARRRHLLRAEPARLGPPHLRGDRADEDRPLRQPVLRRHGRRGLRGHRAGAARRGRRARAQAGPPARRRARDRRHRRLRRRLRRLAPPSSPPSSSPRPRERGAEMVVAGPAFTSGRYGLACARVAAAASEAGLPALAAMHPDNPGLGEAAGTAVVESGETARQMKDSLERFAAAALKIAAGEELTAAGRAHRPGRAHQPPGRAQRGRARRRPRAHAPRRRPGRHRDPAPRLRQRDARRARRRRRRRRWSRS